MRKIIKLPQIVLILISILFLILSTMQYFYVLRTENVIRARFSRNTITAKQLDEYYENYKEEQKRSNKQTGNIPDVTLWNLESQVLVTSGEYFSEKDFSVLEGYGELEKIMPGQRIEGVYPSQNDTQGCAISDEGAKALFGSSQVIGKKLNIDDREYIIRGIIKAKSHLVWIQNPDAESYPYAELSYENKTEASKATEWISSLGFPTADAILAGCDYAAFNLMFLTLPLWLFFLYCYMGIKRGIKTVKNRNVSIVLFTTWCIGFAVLVYAGIRLSFRFSLDYIPKRWSNFSFFGTKFEQLVEASENIAKLKSLPGDAELLKHSRNSAYLAWGSLIFMGGGTFFWKRKSE